MLIPIPELLTGAATAGKEGTSSERSSRWGAAAPSACSAREHLAFQFLQELLHAPHWPGHDRGIGGRLSWGAGSCTHPGIRHLELPEYVLWHVVLCHGVHHEVLVPGRALCRPVLVALLLWMRNMVRC